MKSSTQRFQRSSSHFTGRTIVCGAAVLFVVTAATAAGQSQPSSGTNGPWQIVITPRVFPATKPARAAKPSGVTTIAQNVDAPATKAPIPAGKAPAVKVEPPRVAVVKKGMPQIIPRPVRRPRYSEIYSTIPFSRAEYVANPSYRHEATIELMLGQIRPVTKYVREPHGGPVDYVTPYWYRRWRRRVNYHFYYPYPTVYRRY